MTGTDSVTKFTSQEPIKWIGHVKINIEELDDGFYVDILVKTQDKITSIIKLLIDTGSSVSIINPTIYNRLPAESKPKLYQADIKMTTANGEQISCHGKGLFQFVIDGQTYEHEFYVAEISTAGILGLDFLKRNKCVLDMAETRLLMNELPSSPYMSEIHVHTVAVTQTMELPAESETIIPAHFLETPTNLVTGVLSPVYEFIERLEVVLPNILVDTQSQDIVVRVMNPHSEPRKLYAGMKIATLEPLEPEKVQEIVNLDNTEEENKPQISVNEIQIEETQDTNLENQIMPEYLQELWKESKEGLNETDQKQVFDFILKNREIFAKSKDDMGLTNLVQHKIDTGDAAPVILPARRLPIHQRQVEKDEIEAMLKRGVIEPSDSPWRAAIVLVPKKGKEKAYRCCIDFRGLNACSRLDSYRLARIDDSIDHLYGSRWFSTLDLQSGYWQVAMDPEDKIKTAFSCSQGHFHFLKMPFGLASAPATFQRLMEKVLSKLQYKTCLVYLDDVIVYSSTFEQQLIRLQEVLTRIKDAGLKLNPNKCHFFKKSVSYLGHVVSEEGVATDPEKIRAVKEWPTPKNVSELRSFLGLCSYYRKYIQSFSQIAKPLHVLTEKNRFFQWTDEAEKAFQKLKSMLISSPILAYPDENAPFILDTDASNCHLGAVISQIQDEKERVIAYYSRTLNKAERNYCITRKELLAIVAAVKHFHVYLYGQKFLVRTDHGALTWLMRFKHPQAQVARWIEVLGTYNFTIEHRAGRSHGNADALSRKPCEGRDCKQCAKMEQNSEENQIHVTMRKTPDRTKNQNDSKKLTTVDVRVVRKSDPWITAMTKAELRQKQQQDPIIGKILKFKETQQEKPSWQEISKESPQFKTYWSDWENLNIEEGVLYLQQYSEGQDKPTKVLVLPENLRAQALIHLHNARIAGHLGRTKTLRKVRERYFWVGSSSYVAKWCRECAECQKKHKPKQSRKAPMKIYNVGAPLERMAIDLLGPLPESKQGNRYIVCTGDYFTKWVTATPLPNQEAKTVADALVTHVFCPLGLPRQLHSDQGRNFQSKLFQEICKLLDIDKTRTTSYRPQSDGMIERFMRTVTGMLRPYVGKHQDDWDEHLPFLLLAYNSSIQESTGYSPFELMYGRNARLPIELLYGQPPSNVYESTTQYADELQSKLESVHQHARNNLNISSEKNKRLYDLHSDPSKYKFKKGDMVWYYNNARRPGICPKLVQNWHGPYKVVKVISDILYKIHLNGNKNIVVHIDKLKLFQPDEVMAQSEIEQTQVSTPPYHTRSGRTAKKPQWYGIPT